MDKKTVDLKLELTQLKADYATCMASLETVQAANVKLREDLEAAQAENADLRAKLS